MSDSPESGPAAALLGTAAAAELFAGGGEMGARMRATDWSKTRLGPVEHWPKSLKTMLGVLLGSRFPMLLWWGPELLQLYNDAYRPILRDKHPRSLGAAAAEVWAEVWDIAGPMARGVQQGGPATWTEDLQLFINSGSMAEETYFTFSYSPVPGDDGRIGGLLNTVQETTAKVQSERQIRMLHDLAARAAEARSSAEACRTALEVLAANELDLPFVLLYAADGTSGAARLVAGSGWEAAPPAASWASADAAQAGREHVIDDLGARFGTLPNGRWNARPERAIVLPLSKAVHSLSGAFLVAGLSPHRAFDERYQRFFRATADQLANAIANAGTYEAETKRAAALAELDRAKTAFFGNVSHEFRTPLTLILGQVEHARAGGAQGLQGAELESVQRNALRLLRLVNSLLDFARIEAGRLQLELVPTELASLTADLASSFRSLVEQAGLRLVVDCPPLSGPVLVDPTQWEKIVLNLVSNAFKFTWKGEIAVRLRRSGERVELSVSDSGTGIPADELPRIFERFHRVEGAQGRSFEGTGIGLSLVDELVRLHGGWVHAASVEGRGSTFTVSLPATSADTPAAQTAADTSPYLLEAARWIEPAPAQAPAEPAARRERARVLVVDDNADMREYLERLLSSRWRVETAPDGLAALASARAEPPDLVLSDVMMPGLDGVGLLRELRAGVRTSHIPVVLLSARAGEEAVLQGLDTGADDYLIKPFAARELLARVQTHLELARLRRTWSSELERANAELEAFSYSVSHDLRAPLRAIDGFSRALMDECAAALGEGGRHYLERVRSGTQRMAQLIDDLLSLSRITRASMTREHVDLSKLARAVLAEMQARDPGRQVEITVADGLAAQADVRLLRVLLENLLGNAWKYSARQPRARIEVGRQPGTGEDVFFVRDNGAGFSMEYVKKLFVPFQRLHSEAQFEGTGIGLATVQRVITRHGGRVWADAAPEQGATFFFTLGDPA